MDLDLASILQQTAGTVDQLSEASSQITGIIASGNQINEARVRTANEAADAASVKTQAELGEVARQEASRQAIAARIGTDPTKAGWVIGQAADSIKNADVILAQESEAIRQKEGVSFLTNPLGWIAGQLTINENVANYNAAARQKNRAEETAAAATKLTSDAFQVSNALSSTVTEAYTSAMKVLGSYQYNQQASEAAMQGARWNMEGIVQSANLSREKLSIMYSANSAQMQEKQYQTELARLRIANAELSMRQEAFKEKKDEDSLISQYIQSGYFNFTGKQMDPISTKNALILYKAKQPDVVGFFDSGLASAKVTNGEGSKPVISLSPYQASNFVGTGKVTNMSPAMSQVGDQLVSWRRQFENPAVQTAYPHDPKDPKGKELAFNKFVDDQKKAAQLNVDSGSVFAPYPIQKVAAINKNIAATPLWQNVLAPAASTGVDLSDPNVTFGIVTNAMREGKISYSDALDLSLMYSAGLDLNNQTRNFIAFGLSPVKTFNASVSIPGTMGKTTVNLADGKTLATALNKAEAINAAYKMNSGNPDAGRNPIFNKPDMNVTSDINNFPTQFGPKINSKQPEVKSTRIYGNDSSPVSGQDLIDTFGDSGTSYGVSRARRLAQERGNK